ncbi:MAG TPA: hypothetical protein VKH44_14355 [Pirellulaceae bacterium]|nr:hypothetical protein [Pirellulaceae bacterium]
MPETPQLGELNKRLKSLAHELRAATGPCPFVVDQEAARLIALSHYSGGRDATYVLVSRKLVGNPPLPDVAVTIGYAPFVEGTAIIYDLTDETMQGKARPFVCNLGGQLVRVYALMPFQIEETALSIERVGNNQHLHVAFLDARREAIQAALPFEMRLLAADGNVLWTDCRATDRRGKFFCPLESLSITLFGGGTKLVIRSRLTGHEESLLLNPG